MKGKLTYKGFTLLLGIVVAVIIVVTLWLRPFLPHMGEVSEKPAYSIPNPVATRHIGKALVVVKELFR